MLTQQHRNEIEKSVPQTELGRRIVNLNFASIESHEVPRILNLSSRSKWQQPDLGPGWKVSGVDPKTGEPWLLGVQVRLDTPLIGEDGKLQKYLNATGQEAEPLFLDTGDPLYWARITNDITSHRWITEGAKKAAAVMALGQPCISLPGVTSWSKKHRMKASVNRYIKGAYVPIAFDQDWLQGRDGKPNLNVLKAIKSFALEIQRKGGKALIVHWDAKYKGIDDYLASIAPEQQQAEIAKLLEESWTLKEFEEQTKSIDRSRDYAPNIRWTSGMYLLAHLESILDGCEEDFISVTGTLHQWTGTHYKAVPDEEVLGRIQIALSKYSYESKGNLIFPFAKTSEAKEALAYLKQQRVVPVAALPTTGVPLKNGVLQVSYAESIGKEGETIYSDPQFELVPHDRSQYWLFCSEVEYQPDVPEEHCDRLLAAITPDQKETWLRHLSLRFDFGRSKVRFGRPRAAFHEGGGANGKDSIRQAVKDIFPEMGSFALQDFQQYEEGRKFALAELPKIRISWASENSEKVKIENLKCLISAVTADGDLDSEYKNQNSVKYRPDCLFHFNVNKAPITEGTREFVNSRFAVYTYPFTYSADGKPGTLLADSRYAYNPDWRIRAVSSALLNKFVKAYQAAWKEGINWDPTTERVREWARQRNHFLQFCDDKGFVKGSPTDSIEVSELWLDLLDWYSDQGYVENHQHGREWASDPSQFDALIKKSNDIFARLQAIYPNITRGKDPRSRRAIVVGICRKSDKAETEESAVQEPQEPQQQEQAQSQPQPQPQQQLLAEVDRSNQPTPPPSAHQPAPESDTPPIEIPIGTRVEFQWPAVGAIEGTVDQIQPNPIRPGKLIYHVQNCQYADWFDAEDLRVLESATHLIDRST